MGGQLLMGVTLSSISTWCWGAPCDVLGLPGALMLMGLNFSTISTRGRPATDGCFFISPDTDEGGSLKVGMFTFDTKSILFIYTFN